MFLPLYRSIDVLMPPNVYINGYTLWYHGFTCIILRHPIWIKQCSVCTVATVDSAHRISIRHAGDTTMDVDMRVRSSKINTSHAGRFLIH